MQFGWLNLTGLIIIVVMMIPNIVFALRNRHVESRCSSKPIIVLEQAGRYGSMVFMVFPLLVWEFGFASVLEFIIWVVLCTAMLIAYYAFWVLYFRKPTLPVALWLAILPSAIFILRGVFLRHWLLSTFGVLFAIGHINMTWVNHKPS